MKNCKCWEMGYLRPNMTVEELIQEVYKPERMCTSGYICPTVDKELTRARTERDRREMYSKRTGKDGEAIQRRSKRGPKVFKKTFTPSFDD